MALFGNNWRKNLWSAVTGASGVALSIGAGAWAAYQYQIGAEDGFREGFSAFPTNLTQEEVLNNLYPNAAANNPLGNFNAATMFIFAGIYLIPILIIGALAYRCGATPANIPQDNNAVPMAPHP